MEEPPRTPANEIGLAQHRRMAERQRQRIVREAWATTRERARKGKAA